MSAEFFNHSSLRKWLVIGIFAWICLSKATSHACQEEAVRVRFQVRLTDSAKTDETLFISGSHTALGNWRPDGLKLAKSDDNYHFGEVDLPAGAEIQFKVTQGTWETVEKGETGTEISNRMATVGRVGLDKPQLVEITIQNWNHRQRSTITGTLKTHENFPSQILTTSRTLAVWLPSGYATSDERYPVLYMQDGQNLFDEATAAFGAEWKIDETATRLIEQKKISPVIIVGIWNTPQRLREYTPTKDQQYGDGGSATEYLRCVIEEIKPFIDDNYRTRPGRDDTAIGGSSLGGLFALFAATEARHVFFGSVAFSPSLFWDQENFLKQIETEPTRFESTRLYVDMGTLEGRDAAAQSANLKRLRRLSAALETEIGHENANVWIRKIEGARHNETAWAERFEDGLEFLFGQSRK